MISQQLRLIQYALMFYTRLPVPSLTHVDQSIQDHASRYFPLIGWLIGGLSALSFVLLDQVFSHELSVLIMMCFSIWLTGAFHEDGLADSFDGLGGGWDKATILTIMKDSRVGTYGLVGLTAVLALKFMALSQMSAELIPIILVMGHVLSRWASNVVMWLMDYVRLDEQSKSKPITKGFSRVDFLMASLITLPVTLLLPGELLGAVIGLISLNSYLIYKLKQWLGGYTGDTLGAIQQLGELGVYLGVLASISI